MLLNAKEKIMNLDLHFVTSKEAEDALRKVPADGVGKFTLNVIKASVGRTSHRLVSLLQSTSVASYIHWLSHEEAADKNPAFVMAKLHWSFEDGKCQASLWAEEDVDAFAKDPPFNAHGTAKCLYIVEALPQNIENKLK